MPSPEVNAVIVLIFGTLLPLIAEPFVQTARGHDKKLHSLFWILGPMIGFMGQLGLLLLFTQPILAGLVHFIAYLALVLASNAKNRVLRMVYAVQDVENLRHMVLYPSFYFVHVGVWNVALCMIGFVLLITWIVGLDQPIALPIKGVNSVAAWAVGVLAWYGTYRILLAVASSYLNKARASALGLQHEPNPDTARFGLIPTVFLHSVRLNRRENLRALAFAHARQVDWRDSPQKKPHIIAFQGESYMDLEWIDRLTDAPEPAWDRLNKLRAAGVETGALDVPCWGAYTMQTEMAMLTGIPPKAYGVAKLNPYQALTSRQKVWSIAAALKSQGYRTICLHPAKRRFFRRHRAIPNLGFDEFVGLKSFQHAERYGLFVSDEALAARIERLIDASDRPLFIHAITIESHGPWMPGRLAAHVNEQALLAEDPTEDMEFAIYRQHMNRMLDVYQGLLENGAKQDEQDLAKRARVVGLFGDHQPAHGPLFDRLGLSGTHAHDVGYCLGHSQHLRPADNVTLDPDTLDGPRRRAQDFGFDMLRLAGFRVSAGRPIEDV